MNLSNHPLYNYMMGNTQPTSAPSPIPQGMSQMNFQNPIQKMNYIMEAMQNPVAFVKRYLNIPDQISGDPNQILQYMQNNMGVTQRDIQRADSQIPRFQNELSQMWQSIGINARR